MFEKTQKLCNCLVSFIVSDNDDDHDGDDDGDDSDDHHHAKLWDLM